MLGHDLALRPGMAARPWWPADAIYAADFVNWRFSRAHAPAAPGEAIGLTRASGKLAPTLAGTWLAFGPDQPAVTDRGLLLEAAATNFIRNNSMLGAAAGTPGTLPTQWTRFIGGGLSTSILGTGTDRGLPYLDLRLWGTSASSNGTQISFDQAPGIPTTQGETWTHSVFLSIIAGSASNLSFVRCNLVEMGSGGETLAVQYGTNIRDILGSVRQRRSETRVVAHGSAALVRPAIELSYEGGTAVDLSLRIAAPQLESSTTASTPVLTSGSSATRAPDALTLSVPVTPALLTYSMDGSSFSHAVPGGSTPIIDSRAFGQPCLGISASGD